MMKMIIILSQARKTNIITMLVHLFLNFFHTKYTEIMLNKI